MRGKLRELSRREFISGTVAAGTAMYLGFDNDLGLAAVEPPPEITRIRFQRPRSPCWVPQLVAEPFLREEGFTDIQHIEFENADDADKLMAEGKIDMTTEFTGRMIRDVVPGNELVFISGLHVGCYSLIGSKRINSVRDLKGKKVWAWTNMRSGPVIFFKALIAYVGLDPDKDVEYVLVPKAEAMELFKQGKIDAFMSFPPGPQQLREQGIGRVLVDTNVDRPWSQYFCCLMLGTRQFITKYPIATKRALRALMKANDLVAKDPEMAAQLVIDMGIRNASEQKYLAMAFGEIPYDKWRHYNPEDTIRFYALRLKELGLIEYSPNEIIAKNTDWSFIKELKGELGMTW
ncbi:MAG: ABC transporter substrate-binding protein [Desulfobulbaceae bacterium]|nr:ABC transporter substrate-binding protein [Desulfobulbaceae bacterium]